jgi:hypothetical protein
MLIQAIKEFPDLCTILNSIIAISLLGNIPQTRYYPNFETKLRIYNIFYRNNIPIFFILKKWLETHEKISLFCIRNFSVYHIDTDYVFDFYSNLDEKWKNIRKYIILANDEVRKFISDNFEKSDSIFDTFFINEIELIVSKYYQYILNYSGKINKVDTIQIFHKKLFQLHKEMALPSRNINEKKIKTFDIGIRTHSQILSIVNYIHNSGELHTGKYIDIYWLKTLGIEKFIYNTFLECYYSYIFENTSENSIKKKIYPVLNTNIRDFNVIRVFFEELFKKKSNLVYSLPENIRILQVQALRKKANVLPWESLNQSLNLSYYCTNCNKWSNHVAIPNSKKSKKCLGSITPQKCSVNVVSGEIVCYRTSEVRHITKFIPDYIPDDDDDINDFFGNPSNSNKNKSTKAIDGDHERDRKLNEKLKCGMTRLESINMIGLIKTLKDKLYTKCTICDSIIEYDSSKVGMYGITCCNHFDYKRDYFQFLERKRTISPENVNKCFYCNIYKNNSERERNITTLMVLDDEKTFSIKKIYICNLHFEKVLNAFQSRLTFPSLSNIIYSINNNPDKWKHMIYNK